MATTRPKESNTIGKEKKASPSNIHPIIKKTIKPSTTTTTTTTSSSDKKVISTDKQVPNYLKPTISSSIESRSQSIFKQAKINDAFQKPAAVNRRRSLDKPPSPSKLPKENQPSSRLHKALVSPGRPRQRLVSASIRASSSLPVKSSVTSPKPISDKTSKKFRDVKTQPVFARGGVKRSSSATVTKKASVSLTNNKAPKSDDNAEAVNVELPERDIKEDSNEEEVVTVEDDIHEHEKPAVAEDHANAADHDIEESDHQHQPAIEEADEDEKVIPTAEEVEKEQLQEEKPDIEHEEDENNTDYNVNESINDENQVDEGHVITEEEPEVNEQKEGEEENNERTEHFEVEKQKEESHQEVDDLKEKAAETEESNKNKGPASPLKQAVKKESGAAQVSNDVIEETASKLLETRKNKVRALAGAFQTVIDDQAK